MAIVSERSVASDARESRVWRVALTVFLRGAPAPLMHAVRRRVAAAPIEAFAIRGRRTGIRAAGRYFRLEPIAQRALALATAPLLAVGLLGCGGAASPSAASPSATGATGATAPAATLAPRSPTPAPELTYVAFGDSWPYGAHCNGCRPFPVLLRDGLATATGASIRFVNDVTNGGTAEGLAAEMAADAGIRADVAAADIIVIAIGGNDFEPAFEAWSSGTCGGADGLDCFRAVRDTLRAAYDTMLTEIDDLRAGRPTAVRMVTTSNEFLADPALIELFGPQFGATGGVEVTTMNRDAQCEVAAAHDAICIDLGKALNGPNLTNPQDVNTQEAMQKVADAILAAGLAELAR